MIVKTHTRIILAAALCLELITGCSDRHTEPTVSVSAVTLQTDVIGMEDRFLTPDYWIEKANSKAVILTAQQIDAFNKNSIDATDSMVNLHEYPSELSPDQLLERLRSVSHVPDSPRYYPDGTLVSESDYGRYETSLNLAAIVGSRPVRFGMVVKRANMRTYPTDDAIYKTEVPTDLDRFQENGLFPADAVAILHSSADNQWLLVQSYNYLAWVRADAIAIGARNDILDYMGRNDFVIVTGSKVFTNFNPQLAVLSELQLEMGSRLPLASHAATGDNLYGQNPYASYAVDLPVRTEDGELRFAPALIARNQDVTHGYLPYTEQNIIRQVFKFLGERYGWGHSYNARDCTGLIGEVFKTFGILLPRNSGDQGKSTIGNNIRFDAADTAATKIDALQSLSIGNLIYVPGHVMVYLGDVDDQPYVIHDVSSLNYTMDDGSFYSGVLNGVSVTPLLPLRADESRSYVDSITNIKQIK